MARVTTNFATEWASYRQSSEPGSWSDNIAPQVVQIGTNGAGFGFEEAHDPQMVTWEALRSTNRAEVDALVRVRCTSHPTPAILRGVSLFARLPHQPYTPGASLAHTLNRQGSMLRIHWGVFVPSGLVPPDARVDLGASMTIGDWHWMRLQVTRTDTHETVRGKMWVDGQPEPDWQVTHTDTLESDVLPAVGGAIGVGNGGNGGWNFSSFPEATYEWDYAEDFLAPSATRVRSSVSEDAGSLFQATQAVAVELGISEAFPFGDGPGAGVRLFREALTPNEIALRYHPVPTRNQEMLTTVEGETNLGRLAHTIAPRIFTRGTSIPGNDGGVVTAQQAIQYVVNRWASEHPWLAFEPIPDLRVLMPEAVSAPRQYYLDNPTAGVLTTSNVVIEQEGNDRRTMREVLDEWLQIFPGTIVRQTSRGTIELVPRVGPDAPDGPSVELAWRDLARMSDGEDDPRGIYNRARVTSQGWDWSEDTPLLPPSYVFSADGNGLRRSVLESEEVMPSSREEAWPNSIISFAVLNDGTPVAVDLLITAFGSWSRTAASSFSIEGSAPHQFTLARGQRRDVSITHSTRAVSVTSRWRFERLAAPGPDVLYVTPLHVVPGAYNPFGSTYLAYLLEFDVTGMAWTKSNEQVTSEFGQASDHVPAEGGGNALDQSRAHYGERTATINSTVFQLDSTQARQVAESYVLFNINPRTIRDVQQSEWDKYPVKFDHIGRYVELPNGEIAVVENRSYADSFAPRASAMMSTFTAAVSHSVIDTSTEYLFNSDGSYWENDDGTISEVL